jgi:hypothetical protein
LAKRGILVLSQPPYSPDLALADSFYFLNWKLPWKGRDSRLFHRTSRPWRENWRRYGKKRFLGHSIRCMSDVNVVRKGERTASSNDINTE